MGIQQFWLAETEIHIICQRTLIIDFLSFIIQVRSKAASGDRVGALRSSEATKNWSITGIKIGLLLIILTIIVNVVGIFTWYSPYYPQHYALTLNEHNRYQLVSLVVTSNDATKTQFCLYYAIWYFGRLFYTSPLDVSYQGLSAGTCLMQKQPHHSYTKKVVRTGDQNPKKLFYDELCLGTRCRGRPLPRFKDSCKGDLMSVNIDVHRVEHLATNRSKWHVMVRRATKQSKKTTTESTRLRQDCNPNSKQTIIIYNIIDNT